MDKNLLYAVPLVPLDTKFGLVTENRSETTALKTMIQQEMSKQGADVAILMAVRYPGCGNCMEHGLQVSELVSNDSKLCAIGALKESCNAGAVVDFYQGCFRFPMFMDEKWTIFRALKGGQVKIRTMIKNAFTLARRTTKKGLKSKLSRDGDFWTKGGILVFDKEGDLVFVQQEPEFGHLINEDAIREAVQQAREGV